VERSVTRTVRSVRVELRELAREPIIWGKIERELDRAADPASDLPPEKKQKLVNDVRVIVARWRPFLDAVAGEMQKPVP